LYINIVKPGRIEYGKALEIQEKLAALLKSNKIKDCLLLVEHDPVITIGRGGKSANIRVDRETLESLGVNVYEVSRGGDVTYHGHGQIVGYPIIDLSNYGRDIKDYVFRIEEAFINLLRDEYGIKAHREDKKYTGVWVNDEKITAIGIAVKRSVTMHGFAFNVNTNLDHFKWINPCGITDRGVTSMEKLTGERQDFEKLTKVVEKYFCKAFGATPNDEDLGNLLSL